jgi:alpha-beta hydrolase superfamily lysophospholipase
MRASVVRRVLLIVVALCVFATCAASTPFSAAAQRGASFRVRIFRFVDNSRTIPMRDGRRVPRPLVTVVRVPRTQEPQPLIVFAHGFALTPAVYAHLLDAWAHAGYVVAAPVFPLGNARAPGGANESDLPHQPRDMSYVITRLLALSERTNGVLAASIDPSRIAVAGHSDGGVTALAVAYDRRFRDPRVRVAVVLSGAALPGMGPFPPGGPPLLAVQGTADTTNAPASSAAFFRRAHRPKCLLWLLRATHESPYTDQEPQLGIVERATITFLDHYLRGRSFHAFRQAARRSGLTRLKAEP